MYLNENNETKNNFIALRSTNLRKEQRDEFLLEWMVQPYPLDICRQSCLWWVEHMMRRWRIHHFWFRLFKKICGKRYEKENLTKIRSRETGTQLRSVLDRKFADWRGEKNWEHNVYKQTNIKMVGVMKNMAEIYGDEGSQFREQKNKMMKHS